MTVGKLLFWGGLTGMGVFSLTGLISWLVLRHKGKRLLKSIEREYE